MSDLSRQRNAMTREDVYFDVAHSDFGWMTDSDSVDRSMLIWSGQDNERHHCPRSIDDVYEEEFSGQL